MNPTKRICENISINLNHFQILQLLFNFKKEVEIFFIKINQYNYRVVF